MNSPFLFRTLKIRAMTHGFLVLTLLMFLTSCFEISKRVVNTYGMYHAQSTFTLPLYMHEGRYYIYGSVQYSDCDDPEPCLFEFDINYIDSYGNVWPSAHFRFDYTVRDHGVMVDRHVPPVPVDHSPEAVLRSRNGKEYYTGSQAGADDLSCLWLYRDEGKIFPSHYCLREYSYSRTHLYRIPDKTVVLSLAIVLDILTSPFQITLERAMAGYAQ